MAVTTYQDIYGWETGADYGIALGGASAAQAYILDGTANTGCYYGKCLLRSTGGYGFNRVFSPPLSLPTSGSSSLDAKGRCWMRLAVAPDQNGTAVVEVGNGAAALPIDLALRVNIDRTWEFWDNFATGTAKTGGAALPLNTWILVELDFNWKRVGGVSDTFVATVTVNGGTLTRTTVFGNLLGNQPRIDRMGMGTLVNFNAGGTVAAGEAHFDDLTVLIQLDTTTVNASVTLPTSTRIRLLPVLAQGSSAAWTGSFTNVQEIPLDSVGAGQTSTGAGQVTTFTHSTLAQFGISTVEVVKIYGHAKATVAGPTTQQIRLNGVDYPVSITDSYQSSNTTPIAVDWAPTGFDALEFGFVNSTGASLTLGAIHGEVLYTSGSNWFGCNAPTGTDPNTAGPGCVLTLSPGTDSGGGSGCNPTLSAGADSGGGAGCQVTL